MLAAQQPPPPLTEQPFRIVKSDPGLDELIAPDARLELMAEHIGLSEGPLWIREGQGGYLIFSDVAANVIYKRAADGALSVFLERSGYTGTDNLNVGQQTISGGRVAIILIGSNGLALDQEGRLVITAMADRAVVRLEKNGTRTLLAERFEGKRLSGPNDVVVKSNGTVYFTDSINGLRGGPVSPQRELHFQRLLSDQRGQDHVSWRRSRPGRRSTRTASPSHRMKSSVRHGRPDGHALRDPA